MGRLTAWTLAGLVLCALGARAGEEAEPPNPFGVKKAPRPEAVPGKVIRSDGKVHRGRIFLTRDKRIELYCDSEKKWYKLKLSDLASIKWVIEFEKEEKEWRWKASGSDVKVLTGRKKIDRRYKTVVTKKDGKKVEGHIRGTVVYVQPEKGRRKRFFIYWNHPADFDQKPADLIYTSEIHFGAEHAREPKVGPKRMAEGVVKELAGKLARLKEKYPEMKAFEADKAKKGTGLVYNYNFTPPSAKRTIRSSDFGKHGVYIAFTCAPLADVSPMPAETRLVPLKNLDLRLRIEVKCSVKPSKGVLDEVGALLRAHAQKLKELDRAVGTAKPKKPEHARSAPMKKDK